MSINAGTAIGYLDLDINKFKSKFKDAQKQIEDFSSKSLGGMVKSLRNAETEFEQMARESVLDLGEGLKDVGKKMALTGGAILASIGGITMAGANWSAQVEGQKFLYNNLDNAIQKAIQSNSKNAEVIGLTNQQYKNGATEISTYYKNMGLTSEQTATLSGETMNLVADLAAVVDMPFDDAMSRFKSGLMGEIVAPTY